MSWKNVARFCALIYIATLSSATPLEEVYGYVDVRPGAHMFWVTYHINKDVDWTQQPLIMWLQGGPGSSGVGYGNFMELGPKDINANSRAMAWTEVANVMFVDNPVGTGYSYVDNTNTDLCTDNACIANDLVTMLKSVFASHIEMQQMEFFVYCESYGGKMNADFAIALSDAIAAGDINCNFKAIALGDSWISPMDSVNTWGDYLYSMALVDTRGQAHINEAAAKAQASVDVGDWGQATTWWENAERVVEQETGGVNFYNVIAEDDIYSPPASASTIKRKKSFPFMKKEIQSLYDRHVLPAPYDALDDFMNTPSQKARWSIPDEVDFGSQGGLVFSALSDDFMKPVVTSVENLLTNYNIHVAVYTGNLDLICDTPGTYQWIAGMTYPQKTGFESANRDVVSASYFYPGGYQQRYERFSVHTIDRSGHMAPIDAGEVCLTMIDTIHTWGLEAVPNPASEFETLVEEAEEQKKTLNKPIKMKMPKINVRKQDPRERILHKTQPLRKPQSQLEYKQKLPNDRLNKWTPVGSKFDRGTTFNRKKPDFHI